MIDDIQLNWLFWEGLVPLFGASIVYLIWGGFTKLAAPRNPFSWKEAIDSMGWLYGAIIIAAQSATRFFEAGAGYSAMGIGGIICAIVCGMQLLAAMNERGADPNWKPPFFFKLFAVVFVGVILFYGYQSQLVKRDSAETKLDSKVEYVPVQNRGKVTQENSR